MVLVMTFSGQAVSEAAKVNELEWVSHRHLCLLGPGIPLPPVSMFGVSTIAAPPCSLPGERREKEGPGSQHSVVSESPTPPC